MDRLIAPGYAIVIHERCNTWEGWQPASLDDSPPAIGSDGERLPRTGSVTALYREVLERNRQFLPHGAKRWAVLMYESDEVRNRDNWRTGRCCTPFTFESLHLLIEQPWEPRHLLDVPPFAFDVRAGNGKRFKSLDVAAQATAELNALMLDHYRAGEPGNKFWRIVVAIEWEPIADDEHYVSDFGRGLSGLRSSHATERFHIVTREAWPMPEGLSLELPADSLDGASTSKLSGEKGGEL